MLLGIILFSVLFIAALLFIWYSKRPKPTHAGGVVFRNESNRPLFLIVSSASQKNRWVLPKGKIEQNETAEFAAVREVMEETGIEARVIKKAGTIRMNKKGSKAIVIYFLMEFVHFHDTSTENRRILWLDKKAAIKKLDFIKAKKMLQAL